MRRKIIRQGNNSYTLTLPINWIKDVGAGEGDEVDITEEGNSLIIMPGEVSAKKLDTASIDVTGVLESNIRTILGNAYRLGYDRIRVSYKGEDQLKTIKDMVKIYLLGFDVTESKEGLCIIESIAEPSIESFDKMVEKMFHVIAEMESLTIKYMENGKTDVEEILSLLAKVHLYDNFCRRAMSKKKIVEKRSHFYWIFLSLLAHIGREIYYMNMAMKNHKIRPSKGCIDLMYKEKEMFSLLSKAYMGKTVDPIANIHLAEKTMIYGKGYKELTSKNKDHILVHHILSIMRNTYFASSPIYGILMN